MLPQTSLRGAETCTSRAEAPVGWSGAGDWWPETPSDRPDSEMAFTQAALKGQWHAGTEHHSRTACHSLQFKGISLCDLILWDGLDVLLETSTQAQTEYVTRCDTAHLRMVREIRRLVERVTLMDTLAAVDRTFNAGCACNYWNFSTNAGSPESLFTKEDCLFF